MNEKTMRKWFKTFLMLLPFLFLAIFAIAVRKDGLKYEVQNQPPYEIYETGSQYEDSILPGGDFIVPVENMIVEDYIYLNYNANHFYNNVLANDGDFYIGTFSDQGETIMKFSYYDHELYYFSQGQWSSQVPQDLLFYFDDIYIDEILYANPDDFIRYGEAGVNTLNEVQLGIYVEYNPREGFPLLTFNFESADAFPEVLKVRSQEPSYIEGPQAVLLHFNDMINETFDFNAFGMNDFYDWMNENWFNSEAPLIVKPVFTLLVYEAIIEIIFLMFSFITFVIRFAQQWIDGFYTKGGSR